MREAVGWNWRAIGLEAEGAVNTRL